MMDETLKMVQDILDGKLKSGMPTEYWVLEKKRFQILDKFSELYQRYQIERKSIMQEMTAITAQQTDILKRAHLLRETK